MCITMLTPLMLIYTFALDLIFVVNKAFIEPISSILQLLTCGHLSLRYISNMLDQTYGNIFGMQKMDVEGFRRMRTICQLTFESLIQLILQVRMLIYFKRLHDEQSVEQMGVSIESLIISIALSLLHTALECIFMYMESKASLMSFLNYTIICFNGRFGWVPFNNFL